MGNCNRDNCAGTLRRDGSCSQQGCALHRPSFRGQCWTWLGKTVNKLRTPVKLKKPRKRRRKKAPPSPTTITKATTIDMSSIQASPTATTPSTPSAAVVAEAFSIESDILDHALSPEAPVRLLRNCFRFRTPSPDDADFLVPTGVNSLGLAVASHYYTLLGEIGEPRTLSVFSNISGILQKIPSDTKFLPQGLYVAACFYLGWELAGSWLQKEPNIIASENPSDVKRCALELLNFLVDP